MTSVTTDAPVTIDVETPVIDAAIAATAAHDQAEAAAVDAAARREARQMSTAWVALVFGLVISLGTFGAIATHDYRVDGASATTSTTSP